jgi:deoxyribose-phosphate aldolase
MTLLDLFSKTSKIIYDKPARVLTNSDILHLIDLTLLDETVTDNEIQTLDALAIKYDTAAICIYPEQLKLLSPSSVVKKATVVNFPLGADPLDKVLSDIEHICRTSNANEIDYVFPYKTYLDGDTVTALEHCKACYQLSSQHHKTFKVILETGALSSIDIVYALSSKIINNGCDFLKTSTGKIPQGASMDAAFAMLKAIVDTQKSCGIKISGGVREKPIALAYVRLAEHMLGKTVDNSWFRIGASKLVDDLT